MKKCLFLIVVCFIFIFCNMNAKDGTNVQALERTTVKDRIEVLHSRGKQCYATCMAIESGIKATMKENLTDQMKEGRVIPKVVNISRKEDEKIAEECEVIRSSLPIVKHKNGKRTYRNITELTSANTYKSSGVSRIDVVKSVSEMPR